MIRGQVIASQSRQHLLCGGPRDPEEGVVHRRRRRVMLALPLAVEAGCGSLKLAHAVDEPDAVFHNRVE